MLAEIDVECTEADDDVAWLDTVTRRMYGLALAATRIGTRRGAPLHIVLVSSMAVFAAAPDDLAIQTNWARRPSTGAQKTAIGSEMLWRVQTVWFVALHSTAITGSPLGRVRL